MLWYEGFFMLSVEYIQCYDNMLKKLSPLCLIVNHLYLWSYFHSYSKYEMNSSRQIISSPKLFIL